MILLHVLTLSMLECLRAQSLGFFAFPYTHCLWELIQPCGFKYHPPRCILSLLLRTHLSPAYLAYWNCYRHRKLACPNLSSCSSFQSHLLLTSCISVNDDSIPPIVLAQSLGDICDPLFPLIHCVSSMGKKSSPTSKIQPEFHHC